MKDISGKVAFVTGAANGIGLGICRALARAGAQVALADIQPDALERARAEIAALGVQTIALPLDVSDADAVARAAGAVEAAFGKAHIVCNNAGISLGNVGLLDMTPAQWSWIFGVNLFGVVNGVQAFVPRILRHREGGHIVNTASMAGLQVNPAIPGIGVSVLCPAQVDTALYDSGRRRPERFGGHYERADLDAARARSATGLSADAVGEHVVHAIRTDEYFIFTHPEARPRVEERHSRMMAGFDAAARHTTSPARAGEVKAR